MGRKTKIFSIKFPKEVIFVILFLTTGFSGYSQSSNKDTIAAKKNEVVHSPRKATIYSAVLPGLGQIYNRKYWKVPLVYGGFATLGYFINFNNGEYVKFRQAYSDLIDDDPNSNSYTKLDISPRLLDSDNVQQLTESLRRAKDYWRRNRDLVVIGTAVFYAVNIIDASVDAHFFKFDISDDLTINWVPAPVMCMNSRLVGLQCRITF